MVADMATGAGRARRVGAPAEGGGSRAGGSPVAAPVRGSAPLPRRPDGGIDSEGHEDRARRLRRAALRTHIARLLAALR
jgi:hypothetical protein